MKNGVIFTSERIPIDSKRRINGEYGSQVLLYDKVNQCYYETTIEDIISLVLKRLSEYESALDAKVAAELEGVQASVAKMKAEQDKFIADMVKTNSAMISLVEASTKSNDGGTSK